MTQPNQCSKCETILPPDAPAGICPKCLLAAGMLDSAAEVDANSNIDATVITDAAGLERAAELPPTEQDDRSASGIPVIETKIQYFGEYELLREIARGERNRAVFRGVAYDLPRAGLPDGRPR